MARIGFFVLDWGLGHATRSAPLIDYLIENKHDVFLFSSGPASIWLQQSFPQLQCTEIPGYDVSYRSESANKDIIRQTPAILRRIEEEQKLTLGFVEEFRLDRIISDNRYGCFHSEIPSAIITHQIQPPAGYLLQGFTNSLVGKRLRNFDQVWIPDLISFPRLSGKLCAGHDAHSSHFLGALSRLKPESHSPSEKWDICAVISGPESARTKFETQVLSWLETIPGNHLVVCGLPQSNEKRSQGHVTIVSHLPDEQLAGCLLNSEYIICRSGYSTILDLVSLGLQGNLVPTPGQREQEFLAEHMKNEFGWASFDQKDQISLHDLIESTTKAPIDTQSQFKVVIDNFVVGVS